MARDALEWFHSIVDPSHRETLNRAEEKQSVVVLSNSTVKKSGLTSEMEVLMNKRSQVLESPRKISLALGDTVSATRTVKSCRYCGIRQ